MMRLLPEQVEELTGASVIEIYLNDIFILKTRIMCGMNMRMENWKK